jgi:hypothetical protein
MITPYSINVVTLYQVVEPGEQQPTLEFASSPGTVDRGDLAAYFQFINPLTGVAMDYTMLHLKAGGSVIIDIAYADFANL